MRRIASSSARFVRWLVDGALLLGSWLYLIGLATWFVLYLVTGDRIRLIALTNAAALYSFLPVPLVLVAAIWLRRRSLLVGGGLAAAVFLWLWGGLFIPRPAGAAPDEPTLTIMTYNVLGPATIPENVFSVIRAENPDVVLIQELHTRLATALRSELAAEYPYQVLNAHNGTSGMGVISRFPLRDTGDQLPVQPWVGPPQLLVLDWNGQEITLVNFHMSNPPFLPELHGTREPQARAIVDYVRASGRGTAIAAGDSNLTDLSDAYHILTGSFVDAWREVGFGFGHTWGSRGIPRRLAWMFPQWVVRIDYIFQSPDLRATSARTARHDGISDHRGVVVTLARR